MTNLSSFIVLFAALSVSPALAAGGGQTGGLRSTGSLQIPTQQHNVVVPAPPANPIPISSLPFTINQPGYYRVTQNLAGVAGQSGISVFAPSVVVDLNGFTLVGSASTQIAVVGFLGTVILNGRIANWGEEGIRSGDQALVVNVTVSFSGKDGMILGANSVVQDCSVIGNKLNGIRGQELGVFDSEVERNEGDGIHSQGVRVVVRGCTISENKGYGIAALEPDPILQFIGNEAVVEDCQVYRNQSGGMRLAAAARVSGCTVRRHLGTGAVGIEVGDFSQVERCIVLEATLGIAAGPGSRVDACTVSDGIAGIAIGDNGFVADCTVESNGSVGIGAGNGARVQRCTSVGNAAGIVFLGAGGLIEGCTVGGNTEHGVKVTQDTLVLNNAIRDGNIGILVGATGNRIDGNHVAQNALGIAVTGSRNLIVRNSLDENGAQMQVGPDNVQGPLLKAKGFIQSNNPWANFDLSFP